MDLFLEGIVEPLLMMGDLSSSNSESSKNACHNVYMGVL